MMIHVGLRARIATGALGLVLLLLPAPAGAASLTESFDGGSNEGGWSWGTGNQSIVPVNGHPGAYLQDLTLVSCCPTLSTAFGTTSAFTGDYRARGVTSVGCDIITLDTDFGVGGRPLSVILVNDRGTPLNFTDDVSVWFVGSVNIPDPGVPILTPAGWTAFDFDVPAQSATLPAGWSFFAPVGNPTGDQVWNLVIGDVDALQFFYGDPEGIFPFLSWDVGLDNPRIVEGPVDCPGDTDGSGAVDVTDLVNVVLDWATDGSGHGGDVDGSGFVDVQDLVTVVLAWGDC